LLLRQGEAKGRVVTGPAVPPKDDPATETDQDFLARLERLGRDYRYSDEFLGIVVRRRFPREWPWPWPVGDAARKVSE
jgi:hypothetical protein